MTTEEMNTAIHRLQDLPENMQNIVAPNINEYLNKLDDLRNTIQTSKNSGEPVALSKNQLLERLRKK